MEKVCLSCGINATGTEGSVTFNCPGCGKARITRCHKCRHVGKNFVCPDCSFEGP